MTEERATGLKGELDWLEEASNGGGPDSLTASEYKVRVPAVSGALCPRCGSGEVWQPMQTMDMPMYLSCLRCGLWEPSSEFTGRNAYA